MLVTQNEHSESKVKFMLRSDRSLHGRFTWILIPFTLEVSVVLGQVKTPELLRSHRLGSFWCRVSRQSPRQRSHTTWIVDDNNATTASSSTSHQLYDLLSCFWCGVLTVFALCPHLLWFGTVAAKLLVLAIIALSMLPLTANFQERLPVTVVHTREDRKTGCPDLWIETHGKFPHFIQSGSRRKPFDFPIGCGKNQWEFQDLEVRKRYIFQVIFCGDIPWNLGLKNRPYIW